MDLRDKECHQDLCPHIHPRKTECLIVDKKCILDRYDIHRMTASERDFYVEIVGDPIVGHYAPPRYNYTEKEADILSIFQIIKETKSHIEELGKLKNDQTCDLINHELNHLIPLIKEVQNAKS